MNWISSSHSEGISRLVHLIDKIESEVRKKQLEPKSAQKDADIKFYSEACMQFRYFKDGWRIRVAHTRETYDEGQALTAIEHSVSFFDTLAKRPKAKTSAIQEASLTTGSKEA